MRFASNFAIVSASCRLSRSSSPAAAPLVSAVVGFFLGRGWGHGVGLCQNGAYGMALAGASYDQILRHYYTGIDIVPAASVTAAPPSVR